MCPHLAQQLHQHPGPQPGARMGSPVRRGELRARGQIKRLALAAVNTVRKTWWCCNSIAKCTLRGGEKKKKIRKKNMLKTTQLKYEAKLPGLANSSPLSAKKRGLRRNSVKHWTLGTRAVNKHNLPETLQCDKRKHNNRENSVFPLSGQKLPRKLRNSPGAAMCLMVLPWLPEQPEDPEAY